MAGEEAKDSAASGNPLWDYTLKIYVRPGVQDACLALQDQGGADVNLLLFLCWVAQSGRGRLARAEVQKAMAVVAVWRVQVLKPLRRVRRRLRKDGPPEEADLRKKLLKAELDAERIEQNYLHATMTREPVMLDGTQETRVADARYNCGIYFEEGAITLDEALEASLTALIEEATRD